MKRLIIIFPILLMIISSFAFAQDNKAIRFIVIDSGEHDTSPQTPVGFINKIAVLIMEEAGLPYEIITLPPARAPIALREGIADMIVAPRKMGQNMLVLIEQIHYDNLIIVGRKDSLFTSLNDLQGKTVGCICFPDEQQPPELNNLTIDPVSNITSGIEMLFAHRLDAFISPEELIFQVANDLGYPADQFGKPLLVHRTEIWLMATKQLVQERDVQVAAIKTASKRLKARNAFEKVLIEKKQS